VNVSIAPATPTEFRVTNVTSNTATLVWSLVTSDDESADTQVITVWKNGSLVNESVVEGGVRDHQLSDLPPGQMYQATVQALNQDGAATSQQVSFWTKPGGESADYSTVQYSIISSIISLHVQLLQ